MVYLTATQAATRLGKSEKTIRRWIQEGRLAAHHPQGRKNMLAIAEGDIEKLAKELAEYEQSAASEDTSLLEKRLADLEQRFTDYQLSSYPGATVEFSDIAHVESKLDRLEQALTQAEQRIATLEAQLSIGTPTPATDRVLRPERATYTTVAIELPERLPEGTMQHYLFADRHGVNRRTFLDHIKKGYVPSIPHQKANRKEVTHWLSPEMQRAAIVYWNTNGTPYQECIIPSCPCHTSMTGHDQDITSLPEQSSSEDQLSTE